MNIDISKDTFVDNWEGTDSYNLRKLVYNGMMMGKAKDKAWLTKILNHRQVTISVGDYTIDDHGNRRINYIKRIMHTVDAFNAKFEDDWDVVVMVNDHGLIRLCFTHLYREVEITNSQFLKHKIKDLLVVFRWRCQNYNTPIKNMSMVITGTRFTVTPKEIRAGYLHSHIPSKNAISNGIVSWNLFDTSSFCLGNSSETRNVIDDMMSDFHPEKLQLFLYLMDTYVSWESLEGNPHVKMAKMTDRGKQTYNVRYLDDLFEAFKNHIDYYNNPLDLDYFIKDGRFKINRTDKTLSKLREIFMDRYDDWKQHLVKQDVSNGSYYAYGEELNFDCTHTLGPQLSRKYFYYNGEKMKVKIDFSEVPFNKMKQAQLQNEININDYSLHPQFIEHVITELEQRLYQRAIKVSRIAKQGLLTHTR